MMKKLIFALVALLLVAAVWHAADFGGGTLVWDGDEIGGPVGLFAGLVAAGGGLMIAAVALTGAAILVACVMAGVGLLMVLLMGFFALLAAALLAPVMLPLLLPLALLWFIASRMRRQRRTHAA
jgi:hypothetical protein